MSSAASHSNLSIPLTQASEPFSLPPGPRGLLRPAYELVFNPIEALPKWRSRYGNTFTVNRFGTPMVITGDPELIQQIFSVTDTDVFAASIPETADIVMGRNSILSAEGTRHQRERKVLTPPFHGERLQGWADAMADSGRWAFSRDGEVKAIECSRDATLDIIIRVIFGIEDEVRRRDLARTYIQFMTSLWPGYLFSRKFQKDWFGLSPYARFRQINEKIQATLLDQIARTRESLEGRTDILADLIRTRYDDGTEMDDQTLCDQLRTLVLAGHETTAIIVAWAIYFILRDVQVNARVRTELGSLGSDPNPVEFTRLAYLGAVVDETMRMRPISADPYRMLRRPWKLGKWMLPAGAAVSPTALLTHLDPDIWPDPHTFKPERFIESRPRPNIYLPFGGGQRRCVAATFARFEALVILGTLLTERRVELLDREVAWVRGGAVLEPKGGVRIRLS
jgi:cytochrome P450